jgi:hypothetical protein
VGWGSTPGALNATLEGAGAIIGALLIGFLVLDGTRFPRRTRGFIGLACVTAVTIAVWSCGLAFQSTFTRHSKSPKLHYTDRAYHAKGALYFFYFFGDAQFQALAYWIMGAISNDPFTLARFAGFYKCIQSAGSAGSFGMDAVATPYLNEIVSLSLSCFFFVTPLSLPFLSSLCLGRDDSHASRPFSQLASWIMLLVSFPLAGLVIYHIKETSYTEETTVFIDESHAVAVEHEIAGAHVAVVNVEGHVHDINEKQSSVGDVKKATVDV